MFAKEDDCFIYSVAEFTLQDVYDSAPRVGCRWFGCRYYCCYFISVKMTQDVTYHKLSVSVQTCK